MKEIENDVKKYLGLYPYNTFTNPCYQDGIYYNSLIEKYGKEIVDKTIQTIKNF